MSRTINLTEQDIRNIVRESLKNIISEADRHRPGYWAERWAKQKAEKQAAEEQNPKDSIKKNNPTKKKDRHRPGYYREYNMKHPERLNRGYTKGYVNGNVDDGPIVRFPEDEIFPGVRILGYDEIGRPITNDHFGDLLRNKQMEWHDDDWCEDDD